MLREQLESLVVERNRLKQEKELLKAEVDRLTEVIESLRKEQAANITKVSQGHKINCPLRSVFIADILVFFASSKQSPLSVNISSHLDGCKNL